MQVKFIKDHPSGIAKGRIVTIAPQHANQWIEEGYAEEVPVKKTEPAKKPVAKKPATKKK